MINHSFCRHSAWSLKYIVCLHRIQDNNLPFLISLFYGFIVIRFLGDISLLMKFNKFNLNTRLLHMRIHFVVAVVSCVHFLFDFAQKQDTLESRWMGSKQAVHLNPSTLGFFLHRQLQLALIQHTIMVKVILIFLIHNFRSL